MTNTTDLLALKAKLAEYRTREYYAKKRADETMLLSQSHEINYYFWAQKCRDTEDEIAKARKTKF